MDSSIMLNIVFSLLMVALIDAKVSIRPEPNGEVGIMSGESKYFQCVGSNKQEKLAWLNPHDQNIVNDPNNRIYTVYIVKKNTIKLELKNPAKNDSGVYKCISRNEQTQETSSASFKLHVFNPTVVKAHKESYQVNEGNNVRMECLVTSDKEAAIEFMWTFGQYDLSQNPRYRIDVIRSEHSGPEYANTASILEIRNVSKEHDGNYVCAVDTTNKFISDSKELKLTLRVQYKPRFDEKTPQYIWVSEEAVQQGGPLSVNISCIVYADPVANINWLTFDNRPVETNKHTGGVKTKIIDSINMSTLMLTFRNIDEIRNPRTSSRIKYTCQAENTQGVDSRMFEIKVGRIPDSPMVVGLDYQDGAIILELNETHVEPPIDFYRLDISDQVHLFNKSNAKDNTTFVIKLALPRGEHEINIYAHNPVGWSNQPYSSYFLQVVNAGHRPTLSSLQHWTSHLIILVITISLMQSFSPFIHFGNQLST